MRMMLVTTVMVGSGHSVAAMAPVCTPTTLGVGLSGFGIRGVAFKA